MQRDYADGVVENNIIFFIGNEVEHTPAYGMKTLFVTGIQPVEAIEGILANNEIKHIFFGANHSFNPVYNDYAGWKQWDYMITHFLDEDYLCS
jgi:hypothetical protein